MRVYAAVDASVFVAADGHRHKRAHLWILFDLLFPCLCYCALFFFLARDGLVGALTATAILGLACGLVMLGFLVALTVRQSFDRRPVQRIFYRDGRVSYDRFQARFGLGDAWVEGLLLGLGGTLVLAYVGVFGRLLYPRVPEQFGGGRPRDAQLLVAAAAIAAAARLGLAVTTADPLSPPLKLLWVGDDAYVVRLPKPDNQAVVQINKALVSGVVTGHLPLSADGALSVATPQIRLSTSSRTDRDVAS